jgi:hypothetical protein
MKKLFLLAAIFLASAGCQGLSTPGSPEPGSAPLAKISNPADAPCTIVSDHHVIRTKGGIEGISGIPSSTFAGGPLRYAPLTGKVYSRGSFYSCLYNEFNLPIPVGYSADWFGAWSACSVDCNFSFKAAQLTSYTQSDIWVPGRSYYLYLYTAMGGQYIESYQIGPVEVLKKYDYVPVLPFSSPLQNGFTWPVNDFVAFEIVHPGAVAPGEQLKNGGQVRQWTSAPHSVR